MSTLSIAVALIFPNSTGCIVHLSVEPSIDAQIEITRRNWGASLTAGLSRSDFVGRNVKVTNVESVEGREDMFSCEVVEVP